MMLTKLNVFLRFIIQTLSQIVVIALLIIILLVIIRSVTD